MLKTQIAAAAARLLRAAVTRISGDLELAGQLQACLSSASLVNSTMHQAAACSTQGDVMRLALQSATKDGFACEFGVYKGTTLNMIASHFKNKQVHGLDTFSGLPEHWRDGFPKGAFAVSLERIRLEANCVLHKGLFDETIPVFISGEVDDTASFIHIDCDLYSSTSSVLRGLQSRIVPGTIMLFDEYFNYCGWEKHEYKAFHEFIERTKFAYRCIAYNKLGQQAAFVIEPQLTQSITC